MKPGADVICRELGDSAVLIHLGTNEIFELNATGYRIWQLIGEGIDRDTLHQRLMQEFAVSREQVIREVEDLLTALAARQLIVEDG